MRSPRTLVAPDGTSSDAAPAQQVEFEFCSVTKEFLSADGQAHTAVRDISLQVERASFVAVIGPSGCGKSTLLNMAAGLMAPSSGQVLQSGTPVAGINPRVGYLTQQNNLLPWRTVRDNVAVALEIRRVPRAERRRLVDDILRTVGLQDFADYFPSQLSGGMQKRVAIARILVYKPDSLLMDEPFGPLDAQLRLVMQRELLAIWERDRRTVMLVTHDLEEAILMADKVVVLGRSPGQIIHIEDVDLPRPRNVVTLRKDERFIATWDVLWSKLEAQFDDGAVQA
ncbi:ABC transporter ATP-binding protein [Pseudonocardia xishanensis]|uniref:ABC transporter ATP-binding protein n=1 Tax=Pseudonocardia xishanensis TaxID=630995 RepID=A0ABP8RT94_9PSEU